LAQRLSLSWRALVRRVALAVAFASFAFDWPREAVVAFVVLTGTWVLATWWQHHDRDLVRSARVGRVSGEHRFEPPGAARG
jgi:hypothetical protein